MGLQVRILPSRPFSGAYSNFSMHHSGKMTSKMRLVFKIASFSWLPLTSELSARLRADLGRNPPPHHRIRNNPQFPVLLNNTPWALGAIGQRSRLISDRFRVQVPENPPYRGVDAAVARQPHKLEIEGSNPSPATIFHAGIAQLAERLIRIQQVVSSILSAGSKGSYSSLL